MKIYNYSSPFNKYLIFIISWCAMTFSVMAQRLPVADPEASASRKMRPEVIEAQKKGKIKVDTIPTHNYPLLNGLIIGADLYGPFSKLIGSSYSGYEVSAELSLYNRFFPIWEIGIGSALNTPEEGNFTYRSKPAIYNRLGINYNITYNSKVLSHFYVGLRYGFSAFSYDITDITIGSPYWDFTKNENILNQKSFAHWGEVVVGTKIQLFENLYVGWSLRYNFKFGIKDNFNSKPWYIPGYGTTSAPYGITYSIFYKFPLTKKP